MISISTAQTQKELTGILNLQATNLLTVLTAEEKEKEGFLTVIHTLEDLVKLNGIEKRVIAKVGGKVVAYVLAMTKAYRADIPVLIPMFSLFDQADYKVKPITSYGYIVVGQVCVDKKFRGQGLFDRNYDFYKRTYKDKYELAVTEIATKNTRSLNAHRRVGFQEIFSYTASNGVEWAVVVWDWNNQN
ncbi:MAG: GNAT family N-acetyltransferase [Flavobacteriales bacterium CG_4_9_14_3_um_filter_40_17]|nr:MAG: GNAT family N-acetyltransferase [Flavobacteriales bacterium CG_4_9_14_3_um_filter_40_17]